MNEGDTFLVPGVDDHLWVVISDPSQDPEVVVVVRFLSETEWTDPTCVLDVGDHPFIKHRTCIDYAGTFHLSRARAAELEATGKLKWKAPVDGQVLVKIRSGAAISDMPGKYVAVLRAQGFIA